MVKKTSSCLILLFVVQWSVPLGCGSPNYSPAQREEIGWWLRTLPGLKVAEINGEDSASVINFESCATESSNYSASSQIECTQGQVQSKLTNSSCLSSINRPTVITVNPASPYSFRRTSTPNLSTPIQSETGRLCISVGQFTVPLPSHSPTYSELSSIGGSIFEEDNSNFHNMVLPPQEEQNASGIDSVQKNMLQAENTCRHKEKKFRRKMNMYKPANLDSGSLEYHASKMTDIELMFTDLTDSIDYLLDNFTSSSNQDSIKSWEDILTKIEADYSAYQLSFLPVLNRLKESNSILEVTSDGSFEAQQLALLKEQNEINKNQQKALKDDATRISKAKKLAAANKAKAKMENISEDIAELNKKVSKVEDWSEESDISVSRGMKNKEQLKKDMLRIVGMKREIDLIIAEHNLDYEHDGIDMQVTDILISDANADLKDYIRELEKEDSDRELYSLDEKKTDRVKLPTFGGKPNEDFAKFRDDLIRGFATNRVVKADKITKLRECLYGQAKRYVPESVDDFEEALNCLDKAYGNPIRLMLYRRDSIFKMGQMPKEDGKGGWKAQCEWLIEMEGMLQSLLTLGEKDEDCADEMFSKRNLLKLTRLFPSNLKIKLANCAGKRETMLKNMIEKIAEFRDTAQTCQLIEDVSISDKAGGGGGKSGGKTNDPKLVVGGGSKELKAGFEMPSLVAYRPPQRDENCRICNALSAKGDTAHLYDGHLNSFPTGCPRYIGMNIEERRSIAVAAKLCLRCHDPDYVYDPRNKNHNCLIKAQKPSRYTCKDAKCSIHMWCCIKHKDSNGEHLKKFQVEIRNKFKLEFCFIAAPSLTQISPSRSPQPVSPAKSPVPVNQIHGILHKKPKKLKKKKVRVDPIVDAQVDAKPISVDAETIAHETSEVENEDQSADSPKRRRSLSDAQAMNKLKKKLIKEGLDQELRPIPTGSPQFMIGMGEGKTRPLLYLYDTGCGSVLFRDGVPQKELSGCTLKTKGPFTVKGVGGTAVTVNDEYKVTMGLIDGTRQVLEGWTMKKITDTLPRVSLQAAENEIKSSQPENEELQGLHCEPEIGGDVDALIGILYNSIHPVPIHSLESGLTIYKSKITPHVSTYNSVIGGPHESFRFMAHQFGGFNTLFVNLSKQLESFSKFGPPSIEKTLFSHEDELFARKFQEFDDFSLDEDSCAVHGDGQIDSDEEVFCEECGSKIIDEEETPNILVSKPVPGQYNNTVGSAEPPSHYGKRIFSGIPAEAPSHYGKRIFSGIPAEAPSHYGKRIFSGIPAEVPSHYGKHIYSGIPAEVSSQYGKRIYLSIPTEEHISKSVPVYRVEDDADVKQFHKAQMEGISIDYRCPRCRSCVSCKRSFETERVSLREEAEDMQIWDSVHLDWENKQIMCSLPLRGKETDFLSNNRDIALRILDQQCKKYHKDTETRESIVKAFAKLKKNDQLVYWKDLSPEDQKLIDSKDLSHYLVWRVVFKDSLSTPSRPVFDGSQRTKMRDDQTGGRCLNDAVVKGRITTLNLVKMVLRFVIGRFAVQGDLRQFYASIKLVKDQWHLQRVLFRENLDPEGELIEALIKTLIWGIKCISGQSECSVIKVAQAVKEEKPRVSELLEDSRFVDDMGDSEAELDPLKKMTEDADNIFAQIGLGCKGWSFTGSKPPEEVCEEGDVVSIGGMKWNTMLDLLEVPIPRLHFGKKVRGKLLVGTQVFEGNIVEEMDKFVPKDLTKRIVSSKKYSLFDLLGKLAPIDAKLKYDLRLVNEQTEGWDDPMPANLRTKWVHNFMLLEKLRGIRFKRAKMPADAISCEMDLIVGGDTAAPIKMVGAWARFRLKDGKFSCQHLIGRSLLANGTIPQDELESIVMTGNLTCILNQTLDKWIKSYICINDSMIALCWTMSEKKRLSLFHRNRTVQIRRSIDINNLYHVISEANPADVGTRPSTITEKDVGPDSVWECGYPWMNEEIGKAVENGILKPANQIQLSKEDEEKFNQGLVFEKSSEILTRGHVALLNTRVENVSSRSTYSNYLLEPTKFTFEKTVRIYSVVWKFIKSFQVFKRRRPEVCPNNNFKMFVTIDNKNLTAKQKISFLTPIFRIKQENDLSMCVVHEVFDDSYLSQAVELEEDEKVIDVHRISAVSFGAKNAGRNFRGRYHVSLTEDDVGRALKYLFSKASEEVKHFQKPEFVKKIAVDLNGILFSKTRLLDSHRFQMAGGMEEHENLFQFGLKSKTPVLDRYSPLSYSIGDYIHRVRASHKGYETCYRESLCHVFIIQGTSLFREIGEDCVKCTKLRGQFIRAEMGPLTDHQLTIAPPFYIAMCDIMGSLNIYVPGHSMNTRNAKAMEVKCYIFASVCPTTKCINLQVLEGKTPDCIVDGLNRLGCEVGFPEYFLVDQDSSILKALKEAKVDIKDLQNYVYKEKKIRFKTCPVGGHNFHGAVERRLRTVNECLKKGGIFETRLHATGLQTVLKLIENEMNNLPLGFMFGKDSDNSPLMKMICPNLLKIGRRNTGTLDGPVRLPKNATEVMARIEKAYFAFFKIWNETMVPKIMKQYKWYDSKSELKVGDIVFFQKSDKVLDSKWSLGRVHEVVKSADEIVRRVSIKYQNAVEDFPRFTDRAARSMIKLFNIDDTTWQDDMAEVEKLKKVLEDDDEKVQTTRSYVMNPVEGQSTSDLRYRLTAVSGYDEVVPLKRLQGVKHNARARSKKAKYLKPCSNCCCFSHCSLRNHDDEANEEESINASWEVLPHKYPGLLDSSWLTFEEYEEDLCSTGVRNKNLSELLCAVNMDINEVHNLFSNYDLLKSA